MRKTFRGLAAVMVALVVLLTGSILLNDRLRQSVVSISGDLHAVQSNSTVTAIGDAVAGVLGVLKDFSANNTFLFTFLIAAVALVVLMLRS